MKVTKDNIQEVVALLDEKDKEYLLLNNIRIINPITGGVGKRFKHYLEVVRDCQHEHTVRNSYERRSGDAYFTVCTDCGKSWL